MQEEDRSEGAKAQSNAGQRFQSVSNQFPETIGAMGRTALLIGIEFGPPKSLGLKTAWALMHKMDKSLFPQAAIIPLLDKHHIITQVAGHHVDVIKLLPPLIISEADAVWFLDAFEDVLVQLHKFPARPGTWSATSDGCC